MMTTNTTDNQRLFYVLWSMFVPMDLRNRKKVVLILSRQDILTKDTKSTSNNSTENNNKERTANEHKLVRRSW